jgi:FkbM family methyltransferase
VNQEEMVAAQAETVELSGFKIKVDSQRYSPRMVEALRTGEYEAGERRICQEFFSAGDRVLEVGSSIGAVSLVLGRTVGVENFIGFEANPELMADAQENFRANGLPLTYHTAVLRNRVRGGGDCVVDFHINKDFWISSLTRVRETIRTVQVPVFCLEEEISRFHANCLMMDIEGGEYDLLEYAELNGIEKIFMELHYWPSRDRANRMLRYLINEGFTVDLDMTAGHSLALVR